MPQLSVGVENTLYIQRVYTQKGLELHCSFSPFPMIFSCEE